MNNLSVLLVLFLNVFSTNDLTIQLFKNNFQSTSTYLAKAQVGDTTIAFINYTLNGNIVTYDGITPPTFEDNSTVEFVRFMVIPIHANLVKLEWTTSSENDNKYFSVERSSDSEEWQSITQVEGAGNSTTVKKYSVFDRNPKAGTNYYCLKQVSSKGKYTYSPVRAAKVGQFQNTQVTLYANPDKQKNYADKTQDIATIKVYEVARDQVATSTKIDNQQQANMISIDLKALPMEEHRIQAGKTSGVASKQKQ